MLLEKNNKALPINNVLEVQQKLFGFGDFDHGKRKNRRKRNLKKSNDFQFKFDVGDYKDPEIKITDEYHTKYYINENETSYTVFYGSYINLWLSSTYILQEW